jgi:TPR repeat protein
MVSLPKIILVFMVVLLLPLTCSAGSIEGRLAYRKGEYTTALREFNADAQGGPVGTFFLSLMHLRGEGIPKDETHGLELLRRSADEGYSAAQYLLGLHYLYGHGVLKDKALAMSYLLAASADDDYRAFVLLKILEKGSRGEKKDRESVVAEVKRKAKSNVSDAQFTLAFMYLVGDGVPKDGGEEVRWYRAAAAKNARAAFMLSLMHHYGEGVAKNPTEAVRLMRIAAEQGDSRAQYFLGTFYYQGVGSQVDRSTAAAWFRLSAESGYAEAQLAYGMILLSGDGVPQNKGQAIEWLSKAAQKNNSSAREVIGELLTYRGTPIISLVTGKKIEDTDSDRNQVESKLRLEGKGLILDQGQYRLKFSLPTLYDAYAPQTRMPSHTVWDAMQGGTFEIIFRQPK